MASLRNSFKHKPHHPTTSEHQPMLSSHLRSDAPNLHNDTTSIAGRSRTLSFPRRHSDPAEIEVDSPTNLFASYFHRKTQSGGEVFLDIDMEMLDLRRERDGRDFHRKTQSGGEVFPDMDMEMLDLRRERDGLEDAAAAAEASSSSSGSGREVRARSERSGGNDEVSGDVRRSSGVVKSKMMRSRLMDPPPLRSSSATTSESGEGDSGHLLADEDLPEEIRQTRFGGIGIGQFVVLVLILVGLVCTLSIPALKHRRMWDLRLWKWEVLVLVLICGRLFSGWGVRVAVIFFERNFLLRKKVLYFVYGVRKASQNCVWLGLVLLAWHLLFDKKVERESRRQILPYVTKVFDCLFVTTVLWLVKTLLLKVLASSYHVSTYFERIREALFNQYVIQTLSGPPLTKASVAVSEEERVMAELQTFQNVGASVPRDLRDVILPSKSGNVVGGSRRKSFRFSGESSPKRNFSREERDQSITMEQVNKLNQKNVSAWNMKRLINIVRLGTLSTLHDHITNASRADETAADETAIQIRSEFEAKAAAKKIFTNVAKPRAKYIYLGDLLHFMKQDDAIKTMSLFNGAQETNRVSSGSLKGWLVNAFRERRALSLTLNDTKTSVRKLHQMVDMALAVIILVLWLLILGIATSRFLVFLSSQILLVVFIFGNTFKTVFEAIIFLFVMHPFDVGDRCEVDGVQMLVEEMNIMTTIFLRYDNQLITYPNSVLSTKPIANFYRSPDMGDAIDFCIHVTTPVEKIAAMKERIKRFIEDKNEYWHPSPIVFLRDIEDMNRLKVSVWLQHRMNHQDMGERWSRRELVVQQMIQTFRELDIEYRMLPFDVNIRHMPALTSSWLPPTWQFMPGSNM